MKVTEKPWLHHYDTGVPSRLDYPAITLVDLIQNQARKLTNNSCILYEDQSYTYRQVDLLSNKIRDGLLAIGCRPGDSISLMMPNIPAFVIIYIGILKMGGVVVALNPTYQPREVSFHLHDSRSDVIFALESHLPILTQVSEEHPIRMIILAHPEEQFSVSDVPTTALNHTATGSTGILRLKELLSIYGVSDPIITILPDSPAILQYSGGTTGVPKAAVGSHRNLISNVYQFSTWLLQKKTRQPVLAAIPLFHVYGMVLGMWLAIQLGTSMILVSNPGKGKTLFEAIRKYKPAVFPCVPSLYYAILHSEYLAEYRDDLKVLKVCISGSAPLQANIKESFEQLISGRLVEGYGLSEAPTATHCNPVQGANKTGSIGMPLSDVECRIISLSEPFQDLAADEEGELLIKGPQIMQRYFHREEETKLVLINGWLYTGDIARMDNDGYFYILGRKKDLIKVGGLQVWPSEIEDVILSFPGVAEVAVAGITDEHRGEIPVAWVVSNPGAVLDVHAIMDHCKKNLANYKQPREILLIDNLPRSTVGKVLRRNLVETYLNLK